MFVTLSVVGLDGRQQLVQLSDSKLTIRRLMDILALSLRSVRLASGASLHYTHDGVRVVVATDADVVELFGRAKAMEPSHVEVCACASACGCCPRPCWADGIDRIFCCCCCPVPHGTLLAVCAAAALCGKCGVFSCCLARWLPCRCTSR
jgi:hypothetical protein